MQLKKRKRIIYSVILLVVILLSNISPIHDVFSLFGDSDHFRYSNYNGEFTFVEFKGRDTAMLKRKLEHYKSEKGDSVIYRLFSKNPLAFWRINKYYTDPKYKLPYKSWAEIKAKRKYELKNSNNWQDF